MSEAQSTLLGSARRENRQLMQRWWQDLSAANETGRPVANVFVIGSMMEILSAFDFVVNFPEITSLQTAVRGRSIDYLLAAEDIGYSPDICGYVKVDVGLHLKDRQHPEGKLPKPDLVITCNGCNTYIKWAEIWERLYGVPVLVLDLPGYRGSGFTGHPDSGTFASDCKYVEAQIRELITLCERVTGKRFDIDRLREAMKNVNQQAAAYRAMLELNQHRPAPFDTVRDGVMYMGVANAYRGLPEGVAFMENALHELQERVRLGMGALPEEKYRLVLAGTACYSHFRPWLDLFYRWGGAFVHSHYMVYAGGGLDQGIDYDLSRPIESLAEQTVLTSQRSISSMFFSEHWQEQVCRDWQADGLVFHGVKSCRTVSTVLADQREWQVRNNGIPGLLIESDLVDPRLWSEAQLRNRIDAFFEALANRRAGQGA